LITAYNGIKAKKHPKPASKSKELDLFEEIPDDLKFYDECYLKVIEQKGIFLTWKDGESCQRRRPREIVRTKFRIKCLLFCDNLRLSWLCVLHLELLHKKSLSKIEH